MYRYWYILILLFLFSCSEFTETAKPTRDLRGKPMTITVHEFPNERKMRAAIKEAGFDVDNPTNKHHVKEILLGYSIYSYQDTNCDIYLVRPTVWPVDGRPTTTLGHELEHCLYGDYHK